LARVRVREVRLWIESFRIMVGVRGGFRVFYLIMFLIIVKVINKDLLNWMGFGAC
jgi:hypothetical protein